MSTNVYMRRVKPRTVLEYDETHVCKMSYGWRVHFDGSSAQENIWDQCEDHEPHIGSIDDLRGYLATGEWELYDEYGDPITLDQVLDHDRNERNTRIGMCDYVDREGYPWSVREFS